MKIEDIVIANIYLEKECVKKDVPFVRYRIDGDKRYYLPIPFFKNIIQFMCYKGNYQKFRGKIVNVKDNSTEYFQEEKYDGD
ncbi:MAG: hypothetical protein MJ152_02810, partial [Clostridia bacterium]|nr:hypothetical protein [Clostridia bacterium]